MTHRTDLEERQPTFRPLESITILAIVGILGLALGLIALARPATKVEAQKLSYSQSGTFAYSATAPARSVYGASGLTTGQPIVTKLVGPVHATFDYKLTSDAPVAVHGTAALTLTVNLGQGLKKTFPVTDSKPFTGDTASVAGVLPLDQVQTFIDLAGHDLGVGAGSNTTVTLRPEIKVNGTVGGRELKPVTYAPSLPFTLSGGTLTPSSQSDGASQGAAPTDQFRPSSDGAVSYSASVPNTVPLLFVHPQVRPAMYAGFGVALICLLLCLWFARPLRAGRSVGDRDRIRALYGAQLVPVTAIDAHYGPIVEVTGIEALAELAKKYESMIMQLMEPEADSYLVWDNGIMFRYRVPHATDSVEMAPRVGAHDSDSTVVLPRLVEGDALDGDDDMVGGVEQLLRGDIGDLDGAGAALVSSRGFGPRSRGRSRSRAH